MGMHMWLRVMPTTQKMLLGEFYPVWNRCWVHSDPEESKALTDG